MNEIDATDLLKAEKYLRFFDLRSAPDYCDLTVWVDGAEASSRAGPAGTGNAEIDAALGPVHRIETVPGCLRYQIVFDDAVGYAVRNESFANPEAGEDYTTFLRDYQTSSFLTFMRERTFAEATREKPLKHIAVVTLDLIIDVATFESPLITAKTLGPDDPGQRDDLPQEHG